MAKEGGYLEGIQKVGRGFQTAGKKKRKRLASGKVQMEKIET